MKYAITGGAGNTSRPITTALLQAGHQVTVIGRNKNKLEELAAAGASTAIGSVEDAAFLTEAFAGADAVYTMVPPTFEVTDWLQFIENVGKNYAAAIQANNIRFVVNLSSIGAHMPQGAGPVSGLHRVEQTLNALPDVNILHLRPAYFYYNLLAMAGMIKHMNMIGSNFGGNEHKLAMVHPRDIAKAAAEELSQLRFRGHSVRYIAGDERSGEDIAKVLGAAVGKPDLTWIMFTDEQSLQGMLQAGLPHEIAAKYVEMGGSLRNGKMAEDYQLHKPAFSETKLEDFAPEFGAIYNQQ